MGNPKWYVTVVKAASDYSLHLEFADGKKGIVYFRPELEKSLYRRHRDIGFFLRAEAVDGTVTWPDGSELSSIDLYDECIPTRQPGTWDD